MRRIRFQGFGQFPDLLEALLVHLADRVVSLLQALETARQGEGDGPVVLVVVVGVGLVEEKRGRERRLGQLRTTIEELWDRLGIEERERKQFLTSNRGCGLRTINEYEDELARLNELKRQNLHLFVEEARVQLQELWDALYFSEEEMLDFTPTFSDVCSDALLAARESEIARLEALKEQRLPILQKIDRHRELIQERDELAQSSQDATRLMARGNKGERRDPGKLLREEKMRKRIAKELPKIETVSHLSQGAGTELTHHRI